MVFSCAMAPDGTRRELADRQSADPVVREVAARVRRILGDVVRIEAGGVELIVADFTSASGSLVQSKYFTDACQALPDDRLIVINVAFLLETEAALRSLHPPQSFFRSTHLTDKGMFALVRRLGEDPRYWLQRLRDEQMSADGSDPPVVVDALSLLALFFAGHEVGHLTAGQQQASFTTFARPGDLEASISNATVKLARHIDECEALGFGLSAPGSVGSDHVIRAREKSHYFALDVDYANHDKWFADEAVADRTAGDILVRHLARLEEGDVSAVAAWQRFLAAHALCAAAVYAWYKDLLVFCTSLGMKQVESVRLLTVEMMAGGGDHYVRAASLFGEVHRSTLLRAAIALQTLLESWDPDGNPPAGRGAATDAASADRARLVRLWRHESLRRYYLTAALLDTAVKIAYAGSSAGYLKETLDGRPFIMFFESLEQALRRVDHLMT
jgi:hypothetical protein